MSGNIYPVYTVKNECNDCYKCVRACHVKSIKIQDGSASVINDKCIACGNCVTICPAGAKKVRSDIDKVKTLFIAKKDVYVSLAPSWAGVYSVSKEKMITALKKLGFKGISETALGAQEVSIQAAKMLKESEKGLFISSACPVIDDYIRLYKPNLAKYITPIASPALTHAGLLKQKLGNDIEVVFIGPCIAKKNEADTMPELISCALTFDELNYWLKEDFIELESIEEDNDANFVLENSFEGAIYPIEGGMNETIKKVYQSNNYKNDVTFISVSSLEAFDKAINNLNPDKITNKIFLEGLACHGGCINGPCLSSDKSRILVTSDIYSKTNYRDKVPTEPKVVVKKDYIENPVTKKEYPLETVAKALAKISKHTLEDELNCSGCGYATCREFVNALISGDAEISQCVSYMRKIAVRKAAAMLKCMPSSVVLVDSNMKIVEANNAFLNMFVQDMSDVFSSCEDIKGAAIDRIISFPQLFQSALVTGKDIHQEHYSVNEKLYDITIFTIEDNELVGAVITDVTKTELDRNKIAQKAREVITKNIATVQEIACLLGEHMVETELLLNNIAQGYETNNLQGEDKK